MITDREFRNLKKQVQANQLGLGVGYRLKRTAAGTTLQIKPGSSTAGESCPFDMFLNAVDDDLILTFAPGAVNFLLPDNIFDEFTVSDSGTTKVKVRATSDGQTITSCTLIVDGTDAEEQAPTPWGLPLSVDILIGVIKDGTAYRTIACGSVNLSGVMQFETERVADPGESPRVPYYSWVQQ